MIIRRLHENENGKLDAIQSLAFSFSYDKEASDGEGLNSEVYGAFLDDDETLTATIITPEYKSIYNGQVFSAVGIGGVASVPEYRRLGAVREIFNHIFSLAPERGWATSYLYPFSFTFYRQFGYERVIKRCGLKIPADALARFPRNTNAKLYEKDGSVKKEDLLTVYNEWAMRNNITFYRNIDCGYWSDKPHKSQKLTYLWYNDNGKPEAYASFRCKNGRMDVYELCYISPDSLRGMLGFLRMFEGQVQSYDFLELPEECELDLVLGKYIDAEYRVESGAMGRVLLPELLLKSNKYPTERGHFRLRTDDFIEYNRFVWEVEYGNGEVSVTKKDYDSEFDVSMTPPAFSRLLLGCGSFNTENAAYLDGVSIANAEGAEHLFKAFPKKNAVIYERF